MVMTLRTLGHDDAPALGGLAAQLATEPRRFGRAALPKPSAGWRARLAHPCRVRAVGAFVDGALVGVGRLVPAGADRAELLVAVTSGHRGRGIGAALVGAALELAAELELGAVVAAVERRNPAAMALCARRQIELRELAPGRVEVILGVSPIRCSA
ncbi:MAG: N-acetyltransferase family protein [Acidimicrobiales bacterium]